MPPSDPFSFFVRLDIVVGDCVVTAGWQIHAGTVTPLGLGLIYLLDDGSVFIDTGCEIDPAAAIEIMAQTGSQEDETTTQVVFANFAVTIDTAAVNAAQGPFDMSRVVFNLVDQTKVPAGSP